MEKEQLGSVERKKNNKRNKKRDSGTGFLTKVKKANKKAHPSPVQKKRDIKKKETGTGNLTKEKKAITY